MLQENPNAEKDGLPFIFLIFPAYQTASEKIHYTTAHITVKQKSS